MGVPSVKCRPTRSPRSALMAMTEDAVTRTAEEANGPSVLGPGWRWAIPTALGLAAAAAFLPVLGQGFVKWDDEQNFYRNFEFGGLSWDRVRWAWTTFRLGVYQPLAWMLLEAECSLWGL